MATPKTHFCCDFSKSERVLILFLVVMTTITMVTVTASVTTKRLPTPADTPITTTSGTPESPGGGAAVPLRSEGHSPSPSDKISKGHDWSTAMSTTSTRIIPSSRSHAPKASMTSSLWAESEPRRWARNVTALGESWKQVKTDEAM